MEVFPAVKRCLVNQTANPYRQYGEEDSCSPSPSIDPQKKGQRGSKLTVNPIREDSEEEERNQKLQLSERFEQLLDRSVKRNNLINNLTLLKPEWLRPKTF